MTGSFFCLGLSLSLFVLLLFVCLSVRPSICLRIYFLSLCNSSLPVFIRLSPPPVTISPLIPLLSYFYLRLSPPPISPLIPFSPIFISVFLLLLSLNSHPSPSFPIFISVFSPSPHPLPLALRLSLPPSLQSHLTNSYCGFSPRSSAGSSPSPSARSLPFPSPASRRRRCSPRVSWRPALSPRLGFRFCSRGFAGCLLFVCCCFFA